MVPSNDTQYKCTNTWMRTLLDQRMAIKECRLGVDAEVTQACAWDCAAMIALCMGLGAQDWQLGYTTPNVSSTIQKYFHMAYESAAVHKAVHHSPLSAVAFIQLGAHPTDLV